MYHLYILYSTAFDKFYVGSTKDIDARLTRHNKKMVPSTRFYVPWILVYKENYLTRACAEQREKEIKRKKSRKFIESLVDTSRI